MSQSPSGPNDTFDFNLGQRARAAAAAPASSRSTSRGRRLGTSDTGTVALAVAGMAFYWMLPLLGRHRAGGKRPSRPAR